MLDLVDIGERPLEAYRHDATDALLDAVRAQAAPLRGARVLHVNATPYGGGVSELLRSMVPLLHDLGIEAEWRIINGDDAFFETTKAIHNGLQGAPRCLTAKEQRTYLEISQRNAREFSSDYDFIFIHDPQPAALLPLHGKGRAKWIWRCHIDTSNAFAPTWEFLKSYLSDYDAAVFTQRDFIPHDLPIARVELIPPAIDPESPKNLGLPRKTAVQVLEWIGVRAKQPLMTQVSRFDPWKDPLGVLRAYMLVREEVPDLQLALVGSLAMDDPQGWDIYRHIRAETRGDPDIHVFTNLVGVGNIEVNAFQTLSNVVVQKSLREGFGLVVSESLWKGTPVVAGRAGGIPLQMADGVGGMLVESVEECAQAVLTLLRDPARARHLGATGKERVRAHFLLPRLVLNNLELMCSLACGEQTRRYPRDPTCGIALAAPGPGWVRHGAHVFCSCDCRDRFLRRHPADAAVAGAPAG